VKKTYRGSCHCGAVRYQCQLDLAEGTSRCNCSACVKGGFWKAIVPAADFNLLQGEDQLTRYQFGSGSIQHLFCRTCAVKSFGRGEAPGLGRFVAVNVGCLEVSDEELAAAPLIFQDGKHERWEHSPGETRHL
jgi:hypothetical protein